MLRDRKDDSRPSVISLLTVLASVVTVVLLVVALLVGCTSSDELAADEDAEPTEIPSATPIPPTPTTPPLPSPTPTIPDSGNGPIIIGLVTASTQVMGQRDIPAAAAIRREVERINAAGGLLDRPVELVEIDTTSRKSVTESAAEELVARGADLLMVTCDLDFARPAIDVAQEAGVLTVTPCGMSERWARVGPLVASFGISAEHEGRVLAQWAWENGYRSTAVLLDKTNPDVEDFCASFQDEFGALGGTIAFFDSFTFDSLDPFEDRLKQRPKTMESVLLCTHTPGGFLGAPDVIRLVRGEGIEAPFLSGSALDGPTWRNFVPDLGQMFLVSPSSIWGDDPNPATREVITALNEGQVLPVARGWSVHGADAVRAFEIAVERTGSVDGRTVAAAMERFNGEQLVSGPVTFSSESRMDPDRPLRVIAIDDAGARLLETR